MFDLNMLGNQKLLVLLALPLEVPLLATVYTLYCSQPVRDLSRKLQNSNWRTKIRIIIKFKTGKKHKYCIILRGTLVTREASPGRMAS